MPRLVKKTARKPQQVGDKWICMCGLSKNQPFCDGSHTQTQDEDPDKLYCYDDNGQRHQITDSPSSHSGCCGHCH